MALEKELKSLLTSRRVSFQDNIRSLSSPDFFLSRLKIHIDAKEKLQPISRENWSNTAVPVESLFILDDLAVRKLLLTGPDSFILVKDSSRSTHSYHVFSIVDLLCMPKQRCKRPIHRTVEAFKGKWLVDLRDAACFDMLGDALDYIIDYRSFHSSIFETHIDCWGNYASENLASKGRTRTRNDWEKDSASHR